MYIDYLSSPQNSKVKDLLKLKDSSRERRVAGLFIIEGTREFEAAIKAGFTIEAIFFSSELVCEEKIMSYNANNYYSLTPSLYTKIAYRESTEGMIAIVHEKKLALGDLNLSDRPLVIVLESVEKPGNLGAVLRTADACKADAVLICDPLTDIFNPNVIRSSLGGVFTNKVVVCDSMEAIKWLKRKAIKIHTAELEAATWYHQTNFEGATAFIMGAESNGLSRIWRENADSRIKIPMLGELDSLNVSVSTAILCYEALRQRGFCSYI